MCAEAVTLGANYGHTKLESSDRADRLLHDHESQGE
jgi:hypothetical protein